MGTPESFEMFGLKEIAGWWITEYWEPNKKIAALPALQRGFVWKAEQVERLWDSIAQEFPIGSLLLSEFDESKGVKPAQGCDQPDKPTYHLLDGQQRATSIVKGFQDIWTPPEGDHVSALWVDLNPECRCQA